MSAIDIARVFAGLPDVIGDEALDAVLRRIRAYASIGARLSEREREALAGPLGLPAEARLSSRR